MKRQNAAAVAVVALALVSGCSDDDGKDGASKSASSTSSAGTQSSSTTSQPSSPISATGTKSSGPAHVGIVIDQRFQVIPRQLKSEGGALVLDGAVDEQGVFSGVKPGGEVRAKSLPAKVNVVWMTGDSATKVEPWGPCASSCPTMKAPTGAAYVLVQSTDAGLVAIPEGTGVSVQLTKANVPGNTASDRATTTAAP